jgi:hypothetical protein
MAATFRGFRAEKIIGEETYQLVIDSDATIIVGPNGTGKSTFLNVFYLFLTRQWTRLMEYNFLKLTLDLDSESISISKTDLLGADSLTKFSPRIRKYITQLSETKLLSRFLSTRSMAPKDTREFATLFEMPSDEVRSFRSYLIHQTKDIFEVSFLDTERKLAELSLDKVLYLPTYRRIEKDLKSIFPDIEDRLRTRISENPSFTRQGQNFAEIASFGMEDIGRIIDEFTAKMNFIAKNKSNAAAQEYIRDMVRGQIKDYSIGPHPHH